MIRLSSNKAITEAAKKKYEEFYQKLEDHLRKNSSQVSSELEAKHIHFENKTAELLEEYEDDIEELKLIHNPGLLLVR